MSSNVINRATCWESNTSFQLISFHNSAVCIFDLVTDVNQPLTWSDDLLSVLSDLSMTFSSFSKQFVICVEKSFLLSILNICYSFPVFIFVLLDLPYWELSTWVLLSHGYSWRCRLFVISCFPVVQFPNSRVVLFSLVHLDATCG
jgi:hypothetical protein